MSAGARETRRGYWILGAGVSSFSMAVIKYQDQKHLLGRKSLFWFTVPEGSGAWQGGMTTSARLDGRNRKPRNHNFNQKYRKKKLRVR